MRKNKNRYEPVTQLPAAALKVSEYARQRGCTTAYVYELIRNNKNDFKIVEFQGINFIIP